MTDIYNALSVVHGVPIGVEDLDCYEGMARLVRADGSEPFETTDHGEPVVENADPGEPVWRDDAGVTCRRWNWRQSARTGTTEATTNALFIVDALGPDAREIAERVVEELRTLMAPSAPAATRYITMPDA